MFSEVHDPDNVGAQVKQPRGERMPEAVAARTTDSSLNQSIRESIGDRVGACGLSMIQGSGAPHREASAFAALIGISGRHHPAATATNA